MIPMATRTVGLLAASFLFSVGCTSASSAPPNATTATCASPGQATPGSADTHCAGQASQPVSQSSCSVQSDGSAPDSDAGADSCDYGDTLFGQDGDDDDCKYHVKWTSTPICEGAAGTNFTVTVTNKTDGTPVSGIPMGILTEVYIPKNLDAGCDDKAAHSSPGTANLIETANGSGIYSGPVVFDAPGEWTARFHIHEECTDVLDDSPHGHIAFHITVP